MKPILISVTVLLISTGLVKGGRYAGEKIGAFEGGGGSYSGKITDPYAKKTYRGITESPATRSPSRAA